MQQTISSPNVKKIALWILGIAIIATLGTTAIMYSKTRDNPAEKPLDRTVTVKTKDWVVPISASGIVQAVRKINLSPLDSGRIVAMYVTEGDSVAKGEIIARIDSQSKKADVNRYRANLEKAKASLAEKMAGSRQEEIAEIQARVDTAAAEIKAAVAKLNGATEQIKGKQEAFDLGAISRDQLEEYTTQQKQAAAELEAKQAQLKEQLASLQKAKSGSRPTEIASAQAEVLEAQAQLDRALSQLNNTTIRAPFAGVITRSFALVGDFIAPTTSASSTEGATSASIAELSSGKEIEAKIPEAIIAKVIPGQNVEIRTDAYPDEVFRGIVSSIAPRAIEQDNVTFFRVRVSIPEDLSKLKLGMNTKLTFLSEPIEDALLIPLAAVVTKPDGITGVYIVNSQEEEEFRKVEVSAVSGKEVRVIEGLAPGDRVLVYPPNSIKVEGVD